MADMVFRCIQEMDIDNRMMVRNEFLSCWCASISHGLLIVLDFVSFQLYQHIVLSGGSTMYPGLPSR